MACSLVLLLFGSGSAMWHARPESAASEKAVKKVRMSANKATQRVARRNYPHDPRLKAITSDGWQQITATQVDAYLKAKGRTAETLLAAHILTRDERHLSALRADTGSSAVQAYLARHVVGEDVVVHAKRLAELEPNNAYPDFLLLVEMQNRGEEGAKMRAAFGRAASKKVFSMHTDEIMRALFEAYTFICGGEVEALARMSSGAAGLESYRFALSSGVLVDGVQELLEKETDPAKRAALLRSVMELSRLWMGEDCGSYDATYGSPFEEFVLELMPDDAPYLHTGMTVQQRRQEVRVKTDAAQRHDALFFQALGFAEPEELDRFVETYRERGWYAAQDELLADMNLPELTRLIEQRKLARKEFD